jgi:hypothetical protein
LSSLLIWENSCKLVGALQIESFWNIFTLITDKWRNLNQV